MKCYLPTTDNEADERLVISIKAYVIHQEMPLDSAKQILQTNLRSSSFKTVWRRFNQSIKKELCKEKEGYSTL